MKTRTINLFSSTNSTSKSTAIVMIALILSKLTGQVREMLIPSKIGFGALSDAFVLGFLIPDLVYQLLVGGSIQAAITPTLSGSIYNKTQKSDWKGVSIFINITASIMLIAVIAGELLIPYIMPLVSGEKSQETVQLAISVSRMLFPQVFFMMLAALAIGVLNAYKKFTAASLGPVFYNICVIGALLLFGNQTYSGVVNVSAGIMFGAILYFLLQLVFSAKEFTNYKFSFDIKNTVFRKIVKLAIPTLISASIVQVNYIVLSAFTNLFEDGALTALRFASSTWQMPYGVFAIAIGGVMLPSLSGYFAGKEYKQYSQTLTNSLRSTLFLIIPSAIIFAILSNEVIRGIFYWGSSTLTEGDINMTAQLLAWFTIAMVCHSVIFIFNMAFYSIGQTRVPLYSGVISLIANASFSFIFTRFTNFEETGMAIAYALSSLISVFIMYYLFKNRRKRYAPRKIFQYLVKSSICALFTALVLFLIQMLDIDSSQKIVQLIILACKSIIAMGVYFVVALFIQMKEAYYVIGKVQLYYRKIFRNV